MAGEVQVSACNLADNSACRLPFFASRLCSLNASLLAAVCFSASAFSVAACLSASTRAFFVARLVTKGTRSLGTLALLTSVSMTRQGCGPVNSLGPPVDRTGPPRESPRRRSAPAADVARGGPGFAAATGGEAAPLPLLLAAAGNGAAPLPILRVPTPSLASLSLTACISAVTRALPSSLCWISSSHLASSLTSRARLKAVDCNALACVSS
mmetsp:Transcript_29772/g.70747  ORF Transcript_29772/g.70747 Transcript_29772/m.70747 type:complete len:211 (-) Transcript_29772:151-783(-)